MALTLDGTLATAQNSTNRKPIVEIVSDQFVGAIPFDGQYFNSSTTKETYPDLIGHSSGEMIAAYSYNNGDTIRFLYTDIERTQWLDAEIFNVSSCKGVDVVELSNGNIGVTWLDDVGTTTYLKCGVVGQDGTVITAASTIASYTDANVWVGIPDVVNVSSSGEYQMYYGHGDLTVPSGEYYIYKRTSSDFLTWGSESAVSISGHDTFEKLDNPFVVRPLSGNWIMLYDAVTDQLSDGTTIINIFKSESADNGATWSSGEALTSITTYGRKAYHPTAALLADNSLRLAYTQEMGVLHMDWDDPNWEVCDSSACGLNLSIVCDPYFRSSDRTLWFNFIGGVGGLGLCSQVVIDVDTWAVTKCYTNASTPGYNDYYAGGRIWWMMDHVEAPYLVAGIKDTSQSVILVTNGDTDTMTNYCFDTIAGYGLNENVNWDRHGRTWAMSATWADSSSNKLYVYFSEAGTWGTRHLFGYLDLLEEADPITGKYTFTEIFEDECQSLLSHAWVGFEQMLISTANNVLILGFRLDMIYGPYPGNILVYALDSGALLKNYNNGDYSSYQYCAPRLGMSYWDGKIYTSFQYTALYGQESRRGLMIIDTATDSITYNDPAISGTDESGLNSSEPCGDGRILFGTDYGLYIFDPASGVWTEYSSDNIPGFQTGTDNQAYDVCFDLDEGIMFGGTSTSGNGITAVSEYGSWGSLQYSTGTWSGASWGFNTADDLTIDMQETWGSITAATNNSVWALWTRRDSTEYSNKWDNTESTKNVSEYLVGDVMVKWDVDSPSELTFSVANGYLFDPTNELSTWSIYFQRGRVVTLRFGEEVSGTSYWQNQGTFVVESAALSYERGSEPILNVSSRDITAMWAEINVVATDRFGDNEPHDVLAEIVEDHGLLTASDYIIPNPMNNAHTIDYQWIDTDLMSIVKEITNHFEYIPYVDVDGYFTLKAIDFTKSPDHTYSDQTKILNYSPDTSYSSFTNRVTVKGEGKGFIEVTYPEEQMGSRNGSLGWWGCDEYVQVYYSDDQETQARNPRLELVQDLSINAPFFGEYSHGTIEISEEDEDGRYVIVYLEAPNLIGLVLAACANVVAWGLKAIPCNCNSDNYCGPYIFGLSLSVNFLAYLLGVVANYEFNVWARPMGKEKQTFQYSANDSDLQNELGSVIVETTLDDPLCYTTAECRRIAEYQMNIVSAQRQRIKFKKIAHLQDEITDVLNITHPHSGNHYNCMVCNLVRTYSIPSEPVSNAAFTDEIEGWLLD